MKAVVDRIVQYANRYQLTNVETGEVLGTFDFEEVTGTVQQVGTEIDKELFDSIANDLAARVKLSGGELAGTIVTFSDISGTAANVASGDTSATLWGKVKNWFSRLKALAFKNKVAAGDFEAGAIKNADVAADAAIAQSKVSGLMTDYVASISVSGRTVTYKNKNGVNMGSITTQDTTYGLASQSSNGLMSSTDKTKLDGIDEALKNKANTSGTYPNLTVGKATKADNATTADAIKQTDTRETNEPPTFYYKKAEAGQNFVVEFKESAAIGLSGQSEYCQLQTYAKWTDSTGGNITQVAVVDTNYFIRTSTGSTGWGAWERLLRAGEAGTVVKSASEWSSQNPVLSAGQFGYDTTDKITKIGDGTTAWKALPLFVTSDLSFSKASWGQIAALSEGGSASKYFSVGDEKTIELTTGEQVTLVVLGFDHDDLTSGGKAGMSIGMKNLLATTYRMKATFTNEGGWDESEMRTSTMATLFSQLQSDLQSVIKQVKKKATAGSQSTAITTSADKLWLFSEVEIDGTTEAGYANEGEQYEYWKTVKDGTVAADRIKRLSNDGGDQTGWWFRSPYIGNSGNFRQVGWSGGIGGANGGANGTLGVCFGFCV